MLLQGAAFGVAFLIGIAPTLVANAVNAGSPFSTTYGGVDVAAPELNSGILWRYFVDVQFTLLAVAAAWTVWLWRFNRRSGRQVALVVAGNLVVNLIFFMSHPVFTPYYIIPIDMLSLWTLLFATLDLRGERAADNPAFPQPEKA
jgi:4-amino-4-deoxy-L-arabinose transferase-like glycosyltransferase